jgi:hypothetical protein
VYLVKRSVAVERNLSLKTDSVRGLKVPVCADFMCAVHRFDSLTGVARRLAEASRPLSVDGTDENKPFKPRIPMYGLLEDGNFYHGATS